MRLAYWFCVIGMALEGHLKLAVFFAGAVLIIQGTYNRLMRDSV
jgi:hypothetical protein